MNTVNNSIYNRLNNSIPGAGNGAAAGAGGADFASFLEGLGGKGGSGGASGSLMDYLSRRFPQANFSEGTVGGTQADVDEYFGNEAGDNVAVESEAAEAVASNPALASSLEQVIAALEETAGETRPLENARVQRNVMVTSVSIRFSVRQIGNGSGGTLSANELETAFSDFADKLKKLALKFFGSGSGSEEDESGEDVDIPAEEPQDVESWNESAFAGYFGMNFSFSMYASNSFSAQDTDGRGMRDFMDEFRKQGNFQNYMNSTLSYAMTRGGGTGSGPFTSLLNNGMDIFGMSPSGTWRQGAGFSFQFGAAGRGGLSDLMAMLTSLANNSGYAPAPAAPAEGAPEPAPVEAPAAAAVA